MAGQQTNERRKRVRQLWGKSDPSIAQILLEEGFTVDREAAAPKGRAARAAWDADTVQAMRRRVCSDREWWRKRWKKKAALPTKPTDFIIAREEHIASLESDLEDIQELIEDTATKTTARAMLIGERRQTRLLLAKTRGVDELAPPDSDPDNAAAPPVVGLILGTDSISPEMRERLRAQGVLIGDGDAK